MGMIECASGTSLWRGYDYYKENRVKNLIETSPGLFTADVEGNSDEPYVVEIDIAHLENPNATVLTLTGNVLCASI